MPGDGPSPISRFRVFVLAPEPTFRRGIVQFLSSADHVEICGAGCSAAEALESILLLRPDVLVVDISPTEVGCCGALRLLRKHCPGAKLLAVCSYNRVHIAQAAFEAGAHGFLHTDETPEKLIEAIEALSGGKHYLTPAMAEKLSTSLLHEQQLPPRPNVIFRTQNISEDKPKT